MSLRAPTSTALRASRRLSAAAPVAASRYAVDSGLSSRVHQPSPVTSSQDRSLTYTSRLSNKSRSAKILLEDSEKGFGFVRHNPVSPKPRDKAVTEIRGPYYSVMGTRYLSDVLETMGTHVDGLKFAGGSFSLFPEARLRELIELAHAHGVYVSTGGWIEHILSSSGGGDHGVVGAVDRYLDKCKSLGFDVIELSTGFLSLPGDDWLRLAARVQEKGLKPKPEIGIQFGAGGDTSAAELEGIGTSDPAKAIGMARKFVDAGVERLMIESEGITENVKAWRTDVIQAILRDIPMERVMFEAADPAVFNWYIREFGVDVNLFVDHSQIVQLAGLRAGIWGKSDTFGGCIFSRLFVSWTGSDRSDRKVVKVSNGGQGAARWTYQVGDHRCCLGRNITPESMQDSWPGAYNIDNTEDQGYVAGHPGRPDEVIETESVRARGKVPARHGGPSKRQKVLGRRIAGGRAAVKHPGAGNVVYLSKSISGNLRWEDVNRKGAQVRCAPYASWYFYRDVTAICYAAAPHESLSFVQHFVMDSGTEAQLQGQRSRCSILICSNSRNPTTGDVLNEIRSSHFHRSLTGYFSKREGSVIGLPTDLLYKTTEDEIKKMRLISFGVALAAASSRAILASADDLPLPPLPPWYPLKAWEISSVSTSHPHDSPYGTNASRLLLTISNPSLIPAVPAPHASGGGYAAFKTSLAQCELHWKADALTPYGYSSNSCVSDSQPNDYSNAQWRVTLNELHTELVRPRLLLQPLVFAILQCYHLRHKWVQAYDRWHELQGEHELGRYAHRDWYPPRSCTWYGKPVLNEAAFGRIGLGRNGHQASVIG
ncbi:hypothetical protein CHU98_g772 [Xylaria longipes]|nr:hypothetical protein CHU98_g772 [Xylaria longipes]